MQSIKSYTDVKQSKKLAEILPLESADMRYGYIAPYDYSDRRYDGGYDEIPYPKDFLMKNPNFSANEYDAELPCWSLVALLEQLNMPTLFRDFDGWSISCLTPSSHIPMIKSGCASPIEACVVMLKMIHDVDEQSQKANRKDEGKESRVKGNRYYENGDILPHAI